VPSIRVLVAEDDPDTLAVIRLALRKAGHTILAVENGAEVSARVSEWNPDVILLDWVMPGLDGIDVCRQLKADPHTRDVPVVFLTGNTDEHELQCALALGAIGYITKPFDPVTLGDKVAQLFEEAQSSREVNRSSPSQDDESAP
jgi:CheY-like chemotaxis protein